MYVIMAGYADISRLYIINWLFNINTFQMRPYCVIALLQSDVSHHCKINNYLISCLVRRTFRGVNHVLALLHLHILL